MTFVFVLSSVALCRAMLMKVDLLLLDEPTNHLDANSVAWLQGCKLNIYSSGM